MHRLIRLVVAAPLLLLAPSSALPARALPASTVAESSASIAAKPPARLLLAYLDCVNALRAGQADAAVAKMNAHGAEWLADALREVKAAIRAGESLGPLDIQAAVLLHLGALRQPGTLPSVRAFHARAAWELADAAGDRIPRDFVRDCRLLAIWAMQEQLNVEDLVVQLGEAMQRFPDDAELLLAQGSLWELLAALPDTEFLRFDENDAIRPIAVLARDTVGGHRVAVRVDAPGIYERCARVYEQALARSPRLDEARLRLARVLTQAGRFPEAVRVIGPLVQGDRAGLARELRYLAALFYGRAMLGLGRADAAASSYRVAGDLFPGCQVPQVALSAALRASGDQAGARAVVSAMLLRRLDCALDPWLRYAEGQTWRLESLVARLQNGVRE